MPRGNQNMNKKDVKRLKDIGIHILGIKYSYPDEEFLTDIGFWNYDDWDDQITFRMDGRIESAKHARQIEKALLTLVKAEQSDDPRIKEMLDELETLINLTENSEKCLK